MTRPATKVFSGAGGSRVWRTIQLASLILAAVASAARAADHHALIVWAGRYAQLERPLPGIEHDAVRARDIAQRLGVPAALRQELGDAAATRQAILEAFERLEQRIAPGDRVFIYFSGHGRQIPPVVEGSRCTEGIVTHDGWLVADVTLERLLQRLSARAAQVVMLNDSCHAGGAATRGVRPPAPDEEAKTFPGALVPRLTGLQRETVPVECGRPTNAPAGWTRALAYDTGAAAAGRPRGSVVYLAAARADELAFASPLGSRATRAWHACLTDPAADRDGDGQVSADEWRRCAQRLSDAGGHARQTLTLIGSRREPLWPVDR